MAEPSFESIINDLKKGKYAPVYLLQGDEPYFIDEIVSFIENNVIDESMRDFNQTVVYGRDVSARDVADLASRFPMMGEKQVVIVKEAQDLTANNRKLDALEPYLENPSDSTILVFGVKYKKVDKRTGFFKKIKKIPGAVVFESQKIYDNKIPGWITGYIESKGYTIDPVANQLLADHVGNDISRLVNEINKLFINLPENGKITPEVIERNIGISKDYNIFEFTKALGQKNVLKAQQIVKYFEANPKDNPLPMITVMLYNYFIKIFLYHKAGPGKDRYAMGKILGVNPFLVPEYATAANNYSTKAIRKIIGEIKILDMKGKGFGATDAKNYGPLLEFVYKCIHEQFVTFEEEEF
jgi:DNA polymerase-3 subunit delta